MIFKNSSKNNNILFIVFSIFLLVGIFFLVWPNFLNKREPTEFGKSITMQINDRVVFSDGLSSTLKEINDSRCKPDVQCIWQGELSVLLEVKKDDFFEEIRLGTVNNAKVDLNNYTFFLESVTEKSAIIMIQNHR